MKFEVKGGLIAAIALSVLESASAQSLIETIDTAIANNPEIAASRADLAATGETVVQARAQNRPQITGSASYQRQDLSRTSQFDSITGVNETVDLDLDTIDASVEASQNIFQGFSVRNQVRSATFEVDAANASLDGVVQDVVLQAVGAHADVYRDTEIVRLRGNSARALEQQVEGANRRRELNDATRTDVSQAEARLAVANADIAAARADLMASRARYESIVGAPAETPGAYLPVGSVPASLSDAIAVAQENAPALVAARARSRASDAAVDVARGALSPSLSAFARAGYGEDQTFVGDSRDELIVGVRASVPFYTGGATRSRARQALHIASRDKFLITQAERAVRADVVAQWERYDASRQVIDSLIASVDASRSAFESIKREAQAGARTLTDVLDTERDLIGAQVRLVQAQRDAYVAQWALLATIGRADGSALFAAPATLPAQ